MSDQNTTTQATKQQLINLQKESIKDNPQPVLKSDLPSFPCIVIFKSSQEFLGTQDKDCKPIINISTESEKDVSNIEKQFKVYGEHVGLVGFVIILITSLALIMAIVRSRKIDHDENNLKISPKSNGFIEALTSTPGMMLALLIGTIISVVIGIALAAWYKALGISDNFGQGSGSLIQAIWGSAATITAAVVAILLALEALRQAKQTNKLQEKSNLISAKQTPEYADIYRKISSLRDISNSTNLILPSEEDYNLGANALYQLAAASTNQVSYQMQLYRYLDWLINHRDKDVKNYCLTRLAFEYSTLVKNTSFSKKVDASQIDLFKQVVLDIYVRQVQVSGEAENIKLKYMRDTAYESIHQELDKHLSIYPKNLTQLKLYQLQELGLYKNINYIELVFSQLVHTLFPISSRAALDGRKCSEIDNFLTTQPLTNYFFYDFTSNRRLNNDKHRKFANSLNEYFAFLRPIQLIDQLFNILTNGQSKSEDSVKKTAHEVVRKLIQYTELVNNILENHQSDITQEIISGSYLRYMNSQGLAREDLSEREKFSFLIFPKRISSMARIVSNEIIPPDEGFLINYDQLINIDTPLESEKIMSTSVIDFMWNLFGIARMYKLTEELIFAVDSGGNWRNPEAYSTATPESALSIFNNIAIEVMNSRIINIVRNLTLQPLNNIRKIMVSESNNSDMTLGREEFLLLLDGFEIINGNTLANYILERDKGGILLHV